MALKAIISNIDEIDEALRTHYREGTAAEDLAGKWLLDVASVGGFAMENVGALKAALGKERGRAATVEKALKRWEDLEPDKVRASLEQLETLQSLDPEREAEKLAAAKIDALRGKMAGAHKKASDALKQKLVAARDQVRQLSIDQSVDSALTQAHAVPGKRSMLESFIKNFINLEEAEDGSFSVKVIDEQGNARISNANGDAMTVGELVQSIRDDKAFSDLFEAVDARGGSGATSKAARPITGSFEMTREQAKDPQAYQAKRAAAQKAGETVQIID